MPTPLRPTAEQKTVIEAGAESRLLIEAGPGTGKTETVSRRLRYLLSTGGLEPSQILVLSFSRAAVQVLIDRLRLHEGEESVEEVRWLSVRTFDSWTFRLLRLLGADSAELLRATHDANILRLAGEISERGSELLQRKELGFDRLRHLVVDEVQDLTGSRAVLVKALLEFLAPPRKLGCGFTLLGDSCQAIYDWTLGDAAADTMTSADLLSWVKKSYGATVGPHSLGKNHRSKADIVRKIERARELLESTARPERVRSSPLGAILEIVTDGENSVIDDVATQGAAGIRKGQTLAVLCRDNGQVLQVAAELDEYYEDNKKKPLPVRVLGGNPPSIVPSWIGRVLSRFKASRLTRQGFGRLLVKLETPPYSGNDQRAWLSLLRFARAAESDDVVSMDVLRERLTWPDSLPDDEGEQSAAVTLTTIHQSKGREYDNVHLVTRDPARADENDGAFDEAKVLYVGMSRARSGVAALELNGDSFYLKKFRNGRERWHRWTKTRNGTFHVLELGCNGDVDDESIVSTDVMKGEDEVTRVQEILATKEEALLGSPVLLRKTLISEAPLRFAYRIIVNLPGEGDVCLGQLTDDVRMDISYVKHQTQGLPSTIYNLRIGAITTVSVIAEPSQAVPEPWRQSKVWLGVTIHGLGRFHTYWRNAQDK